MHWPAEKNGLSLGQGWLLIAVRLSTVVVGGKMTRLRPDWKLVPLGVAGGTTTGGVTGVVFVGGVTTGGVTIGVLF